MASTGAATTTATESPGEGLIKRNGLSHANGHGLSSLTPLQQIRPRRKYRHIAAVHSKPRTSCLSHDSEIAPSFLGFRNLMVIVLSTSAKLLGRSERKLTFRVKLLEICD
jgi:diacylglycerol O-acyltransferase-1